MTYLCDKNIAINSKEENTQNELQPDQVNPCMIICQAYFIQRQQFKQFGHTQDAPVYQQGQQKLWHIVCFSEVIMYQGEYRSKKK